MREGARFLSDFPRVESTYPDPAVDLRWQSRPCHSVDRQHQLDALLSGLPSEERRDAHGNAASWLVARRPVQALLCRDRGEDPLSDDIPGEILEHQFFPSLPHFPRKLGML